MLLSSLFLSISIPLRWMAHPKLHLIYSVCICHVLGMVGRIFPFVYSPIIEIPMCVRTSFWMKWQVRSPIQMHTYIWWQNAIRFATTSIESADRLTDWPLIHTQSTLPSQIHQILIQITNLFSRHSFLYSKLKHLNSRYVSQSMDSFYVSSRRFCVENFAMEMHRIDTLTCIRFVKRNWICRRRRKHVVFIKFDLNKLI